MKSEYLENNSSSQAPRNTANGKPESTKPPEVADETLLGVVKTPMGDLVARKSTDPVHPGVLVSIRNCVEANEVNLAWVEYSPDSEEEDSEVRPHIQTLVYGDAEVDDYTDRICHENIEAQFAVTSPLYDAMKAACEKIRWGIDAEAHGHGVSVEFSNQTPDAECFTFAVTAPTLEVVIQKVSEYAEKFDVEAYVYNALYKKAHDGEEDRSLDRIVFVAKAIKSKYKALAKGLNKLIR